MPSLSPVPPSTDFQGQCAFDGQNNAPLRNTTNNWIIKKQVLSFSLRILKAMLGKKRKEKSLT